jgi:hypothetical protein
MIPGTHGTPFFPESGSSLDADGGCDQTQPAERFRRRNMMRLSHGRTRFGLILTLLIVLTLIFTTVGCESAGAATTPDPTSDDDGASSGDSGSDSGQFLTPSLISASLVGGADAAQSSVAHLSAAAFDPETFYQDGWYEYAEFIVVPEVAYNYNGRFGIDSSVMQELASVLSDTDFSESFWSESSIPWIITEDESNRAIAAFDLTNLMIRPSVEEFATTPFRFPYDQFSTYELAGPTNNGQWRAYDAPQEDGGDPVGPRDGESFTASEFVTIESVLAFLGTGLLPEDVIMVNLLGIPSDQITDSGILDFPDWQREGVLVEMGS